MTQHGTNGGALAAAPLTPFDILRPRRQTAALVLASPHSGRHYPPEFIAAARLDPVDLRRSEDAFVDELFAAAPEHGAPLLRALFPRAFVDPNREAFELDPEMFEDALPDHVNIASRRVAGGLGTIARVVASGEAIYRRKLLYAEAEDRIRVYYRPYHAALAELLAETRERFGGVVLVDCHSMPSVGGPMDRDPGDRRVDIVLGDRYGATCHPLVSATAERVLTRRGYAVCRNVPYAGGFTTQHYGRPRDGVHALQIEINRALYMDESRIERGPAMAAVARDMAAVVAALAALDPALLVVSDAAE